MMGYVVEAKTICNLVPSCKHIYFCCEVGDFNMGVSKGLTVFGMPQSGHFSGSTVDLVLFFNPTGCHA